jgi:multidrug efflux pump
MMCSKLLRHTPKHGALFNLTEAWINGARNGYTRALTFSLKLRWMVLLLVVGTIGGSYFLFTNLKSELSPVEDRGILIGLMLAPEGATMTYTDGYARQVENFYSQIPEIKTFFMVVAPGLERPNPVTTALSFVSLKPWDERTRKQQEIAGALAPKLGSLPGVMAFPINPPSLGQSFRNPPVQIVVQGNSYSELQGIVGKIMDKARAFPGLANLDTDLRLNKPQLRVILDRDKAADVGVQIEDIGRTLETLLGGRQITRFKKEGEQYDVVVQLANKDRMTPDDLTSIYVRGGNNQLVQLSNLVRIQETVTPKELNHFNRLRSATLSANVGPGYTLGESLQFLENAAKEVLPSTARVQFDGSSREFKESGATLYLSFLLALAFIYLVLSAQFESFIDPLIIMLTVPLAISGALLSLYLSNGTLNVYSQIGMVMLVGLITKNGILIVEFANQLQACGKSKIDAVIESASLRLRPIVMTTLTMILAAVPLAFATGAGAESRSQIGWVVVGGLALGTLLTLFVIPAAYTLIARRHAPHE